MVHWAVTDSPLPLPPVVHTRIYNSDNRRRIKSWVTNLGKHLLTHWLARFGSTRRHTGPWWRIKISNNSIGDSSHRPLLTVVNKPCVAELLWKRQQISALTGRLT